MRVLVFCCVCSCCVLGCGLLFFFFFFFNDTATTEIYTLSLHDALPIYQAQLRQGLQCPGPRWPPGRSEEHTSELQSHSDLVCRLLLEKKKKQASRYKISRYKNNQTNNNIVCYT